MAASILVYLGCYTDGANPQGLRVLSVDPASGALSLVAGYEVPGAIYQALSPDSKLLVSTRAGGLASFRADGAALEEIDGVDLGGTPCHVSLSADCREAYWADYSGGVAGSVAVAPDGRFGEVRSWRHEGDGPNKPRQDKAHCHQAVPSPAGGGAFYVVDLGVDAIVRRPDGLVIPTSPAGAGPRHFVFDRGGRSGFLVFELGNVVESFRVADDGSFVFSDPVPTLPPGDTGRGYNGDLAAAIRIDPAEKRVVVSNRGENSLVSFDADSATGGMSLAARTLLPGSWPRDFAFVTDTVVLVAMERSGDVLSLRYDPETGAFKQLDALHGFHRPVALTPVVR